MATINQIKIQSPDGSVETVRDIAVQSQNVTFQDGETLNDKLQNFTVYYIVRGEEATLYQNSNNLNI